MYTYPYKKPKKNLNHVSTKTRQHKDILILDKFPKTTVETVFWPPGQKNPIDYAYKIAAKSIMHGRLNTQDSTVIKKHSMFTHMFLESIMNMHTEL